MFKVSNGRSSSTLAVLEIYIYMYVYKYLSIFYNHICINLSKVYVVLYPFQGLNDICCLVLRSLISLFLFFFVRL